jgi:2-oxoglutarate/2-oxoacid ferredoxin oxidoreductase subunit alpha
LTTTKSKDNSDISIVVCGAAGQGIQTVEKVLVSLLKETGRHVYATKEYMSRVRGGTSSTSIRASVNPVRGFVERIDVLIPFTEESMLALKKRISSDTIVLFDPNLAKDDPDVDARLAKVPIFETAKKAGNRLYANSVAVGVVAGMFGLSRESAQREVDGLFGKMKSEIRKENVKAVMAGFDLAEDLQDHPQLSTEPAQSASGRLLLNGSQAVGLGAISAGCNMVTAYPMSPGTGLLTFMASKAEQFGIAVTQVEDEISAVNMSIGGWFGGGRSIVTTSGGGFALMGEGISLAGMTETPLVVHIAQRPGPATGLATRTEQGDLDLALHAGHGEFPRIVLAPGTLEEAVMLGNRAFEMADRFQVPVIILTDQYFVDTYYDIERVNVKPGDPKAFIVPAEEGYHRYQLTPDGISPRAVPGHGDGIVVVSGNEHTEDGHITEDAETRIQMNDKRLKKLDSIRSMAVSPTVTGKGDEDTMILCWGSTFPMLEEAVETLGLNADIMHFSQVYPVAESAIGRLKQAKRLIMVEQNATGQFSRLLRAHYDVDIHENILKYDGRPFSVEYLKMKLESLTTGGMK